MIKGVMIDEKEQDKKKYPESPKPTAGDKPKVDTPIKQDTAAYIEEAKEINKEKARLLEEENKLMDRKEKLQAEQLIGGGTQAGQAPIKKAPETDEEYAEKFKNGEVNLFK